MAPDFIQPGEIKKLPEILLDIDRNNGFPQFQQHPAGLGDPVTFSNISPSQFRKPQQQQQHPQQHQQNINNLQDPYMNRQTQQQQPSPQQQQQQSYTPHSSTPPPSIQLNQNQQSRMSSNNINNQFYDPNLIIPTHQLLQQQKQFQPSMDTLAGQKLNSESMLKRLLFLVFKITHGLAK